MYSSKNRAGFDKYYTKPEVAKDCYEVLQKHLNGKSYAITEPFAGRGDLMDVVTNTEVFGFDIAPEREDIERNDFFADSEKPFKVSDKEVVMFTNPPFGTRGVFCKKAVDEAFKYSDICGVIVPNSAKNHLKKYFLFCFEYNWKL